jgi:non-ribosomal peptide synthetase component F
VNVLAGDPVMNPGCSTPEDGDVFVLPASYAQQRLWFLDQLEPGSPLYDIPFALRLRGPLDTGALAWALGEIVRRHETLRTALLAEKTEPAEGGEGAEAEIVQVISPPLAAGAWVLPRVALCTVEPARRWAEALRMAAAEARRPFDLERGPLFRAVLFDLCDEHLLCLNLHHAVADGWSLGVLGRELSILYGARLADPTGEPAPLPEPPIQYADFAAWQRGQLAEVEASQLAWWRERLSGAPQVLELPLARPRPAVRDHRGGQAVLALPPELADRLKAFCRREGVTRFMALLAAFEILLYRSTGQTDLVIGTPLAGRDRVETEGLIGLFANVVALRTDLAMGESAGGLTVRCLLARVRDAFLGAHAHQDVPFERLVEELHPERSLRHAPLVQVLFTFHERGAHSGVSLAGCAAEPLELGTGTVKYDLALSLEEKAGALLARLDFAADLLDRTDAQRLLASFRVLLDGMTGAPESVLRRLWQLPVAAPESLHQAVVEWNDTWSDPPRQTIHALFAAQARATPDAVAVESEGERLTYRELNARANRLAHHLRALGVGPDARVGVCLNRSLEAVVAILAVLKAGGGYVPLEPAYPRERLAFLLADSGAPVLLTAERHLAKLGGVSGAHTGRDRAGVKVVVLDREREAIDRHDLQGDEDPLDWSGPESLAYVVYTSGSTGRPKGVAVPHRAVLRLVRDTGFAELSAAETWLQFAPIAFDASTLEIWGSLLNGARLSRSWRRRSRRAASPPSG